MTEKRFTTNGYYIYDHFKKNKWLVNEVEAKDIVAIMNNLDTKARERSKALSKLEKGNEQLKEENRNLCFEMSMYERKIEDLKKTTGCIKKSCGNCKHFQLDGMFGIWCDKDRDWENTDADYCSDYER